MNANDVTKIEVDLPWHEVSGTQELVDAMNGAAPYTGEAEFMLHGERRKGHFIEDNLASLAPRIRAPGMPLSASQGLHDGARVESDAAIGKPERPRW